jgi:hypothetical protein
MTTSASAVLIDECIDGPYKHENLTGSSIISSYDFLNNDPLASSCKNSDTNFG